MAPKKPDTTPAAKTKPVKGPHSKVKKAWTYKKYQNGMLNLQAPARYMNISKTNSTTSPLLALPAELRNKIFSYAGEDGTIVRNQNRVKTTILPMGTKFRPAQDGDDLPALSLSRVCRQLYIETALLPYMLNHFKPRGRLEGPREAKYNNHLYSTLDFWVRKRTSAQLKAITSLSPPAAYIWWWSNDNRPAFRTLFAGLTYLDLGAGRTGGESRSRGPSEKEMWRRAVKKDMQSGVVIRWSAGSDAWVSEHDIEMAFTEGRTHFSSVVDDEAL